MGLSDRLNKAKVNYETSFWHKMRPKLESLLEEAGSKFITDLENGFLECTYTVPKELTDGLTAFWIRQLATEFYDLCIKEGINCNFKFPTSQNGPCSIELSLAEKV